MTNYFLICLLLPLQKFDICNSINTEHKQIYKARARGKSLSLVSEILNLYEMNL